MPTDIKSEKTPRSVLFTDDQERKILDLRAIHEKETGKSCAISEVIRKAIDAQADRYGL